MMLASTIEPSSTSALGNADLCELPGHENSPDLALFVRHRLLYAAPQVGGCPTNLGDAKSNSRFTPALDRLVTIPDQLRR
jgi:hypothetical protein